jgi:hypothetical protein
VCSSGVIFCVQQFVAAVAGKKKGGKKRAFY